MNAPEMPGPLLRRGPRPLLLHLTLAMLKSRDCIAASANWTGASPPWSATADAALRGALQESLRRDRALLAGIAAYRRHPWRRTLADPPTIWQEGDSRLLDYAPTAPRRAPLLLFVPSLINRAYVLDLAAENSLLRYLAAEGTHPLLLDWGWPGAIERGFSLTDYIAGRLERALAAAGRPVVLVGFCMGGLLALALAQRRPDRVRALALLATPWDFHAAAPERARGLARLLPLLEPALGFNQTLPVDLLQTLFALLDPDAVAAKYRGFARLDPASARAQRFVALEDWLNDGVPLAAPVARETIGGWYGENLPARGRWQVAGLAVAPAALRLPSFVAVPARDRIVPPQSAFPLAEAIPGARLHEPAAGHIGMVAGAGAPLALWQPLLAWIRGLAR